VSAHTHPLIECPQDREFAPDKLRQKKTAEFLNLIGSKYNELADLEAEHKEYKMAARHKELADAYLFVAESMIARATA